MQVLLHRPTMALQRASIDLISILLISMVTTMTSASMVTQCPVIQGFEPIITKPNADLTIGLMLNLHEASMTPTGGAVCNFDAETGYGSLSMMAALAAADNWPDSIQLPGLSIGLEIYDLCDTFDVAQYSAMRYANERYDDLYTNKTGCMSETLRLGVIGFRYSSWSEPLSNLLEPFDIPAITFTATSTALSDTEKYPNFFRTVPPDNAAVKALVDILKRYGWTYSTLVHSDDSYGLSGLQAVTESFKEAKLCLSEPLTVDAEEKSDTVYDVIVNKLIQRNANVVLLWASPCNIGKLFTAVERIQGAAYDIQWLSLDAPLYVDFSAIPGNAKAARSLFALSPFDQTDAAYKTWLAQWYPDTEFNYSPSGLLIDTIHAYVAAFSMAHLDKCGGQPGMCDALASIQGSEFIDYVRGVNFTGIDGRAISFDENGDPVNRFYEVVQFKNTSVPDTYSFQKVGVWTTDAGLTLNEDQVEFYGQDDSLVDPPNSTCEEGSCSDSRCKHNRTKFVIGALIDLHESGCDSLHEITFIQSEAALFAVNKINQDPSIVPNVRLSMTVNDICGDTDSAGRAALRLVQGWDFDGGFPSQDDDSYFMGVLHSSGSGKAIEISQILQIADVPMLDVTATSPALSDKDKFGNFLRVVPSDVKQAAAIADILSSLGLTYVQTINSKNAYGEAGIQAVKEAAKAAGICIANSFRVDSDTDYAALIRDLMAKSDARTIVVFLGSSNARALFQTLVSMNVRPGQFLFVGSDNWGTRTDYIPGLEGPGVGALTLDFKSSVIPEFDDYFLNLTPNNAYNPLFNEYWMNKFECDLPGEETEYGRNCTGSEMQSDDAMISLGMENTINAVHAYAVALSNLISDTCPGGGVCDALFDVTNEEWLEHLKEVDFVSEVGSQKPVNFDENGDGPALYSVYQFTEMNGVYQYKEVGEWTTDAGLTINKDQVVLYGPDGSLVDVFNSTCETGSCSDPKCREVDTRTEFVIEALFDLHGSGCDALRENRFTQVEAALYALHRINQDPSLLPDIRVSMTVNDICGDTESAGRAALRLVQGWDFDGGFPSQDDDDSYLMGMLHSGSSGKAIKESQILQIADLPLIANSATSPALSNKDKFGNFLRTVPSDAKQAAAMADLLASLDLTYIQTINTRGAYGDGGIRVLEKEAKRAGICIANSFTVDSTTNYAEILTGLIANPEARTLVLFLTDEHAQALFDEMVKRNVEPGHFQILASDTWGTRSDYIPGLEAQALGALTMFSKTSVIPEFEDYFLNLTPQTEDGSNPFFNEYWMQKFKCDLPGGEAVNGRNCTGSEILSSSDVNSLGMENIINVIHAYAVALSNLINDTCPDGGVCDALFNVKSQEWFEHLEEVDFVSQVGSQKTVSFDENGDGAALYSMYHLEEMNGAYRYEEIGTWDSANGLSNLPNDIINSMFASQCTGLCLECNPSPDTNQTSEQDNYFRIPGDLDLPVVLQLSDSGDGLMCGASRLKESLVLESLLYALDEVNNNPSILPGVNLGVTVVDSCGNPAIATRKVVGLLGDFVSLDSTGPRFALLGPANPEVAEEIARSVTGPSKLPMVSHSAASPDLNDYPLALGTSAPYNQEVAAMVDILKAFDWKYVGVVFSETPYGTSNIQKFKMAAQEAGICLGAQLYITDTTDFGEVIRDFSRDDSLNVIVAFVHERDARNLLIADELDRSRKFVWVGTDTWDSPALVSRLENAAKGIIVVANEKPDLPEILDYFSDSNLLRAASMRDPYLRDYLQESCSPSTSGCQFEGQFQESLQELSGEIFALLNALYAVAHGANWLHDSKCGISYQGLCEDFLSSSPYEVVDAIQRVTLESGAGGQPFSFDGRSVPATYIIKNYQFDGQSGQFLIVGEWRDEQLSLQISGVELYNPDAENPQRNPSGCSCDPTALEDGNVSVQAYSWRWIDHGIWATVVLALSAICGVLAILIAILFLSNRHSYVVQSASFSLSMWLLLGIILMYLLNLAFMFEANTAICGIRRFGISFVYCVVYAAMIVKSIRANRFGRKQPGVDLNFAGSWSQSLLFLAFLLPEVFLVGEWLILLPPGISSPPSNYDTCGSDTSQMECAISNIDLTIFMMYAYFLVLVTFLSSFGAVSASHAQHEGKSIFVSSLFSILILIAWACVYNILDPHYGIPAISIGLTADATVILVFMFMGKIGSLTKKENADTDTNKVKEVDVEDKPEKTIHVFDNEGATTEAEGQELTSF